MQTPKQKRWVLAIVGVLTWHSSVATPVTAAENDDASKPNVIFMLTDDMGNSDLACYGANKELENACPCNECPDQYKVARTPPESQVRESQTETKEEEEGKLTCSGIRQNSCDSPPQRISGEIHYVFLAR